MVWRPGLLIEILTSRKGLLKAESVPVSGGEAWERACRSTQGPGVSQSMKIYYRTPVSPPYVEKPYTLTPEELSIIAEAKRSARVPIRSTGASGDNTQGR